MRNYHKNEGWNADRDLNRRVIAEEDLYKNSLRFTSPSKGCYRIETLKCVTVMFYPKSGIIIWKTHRTAQQQKFVSDDAGKLMQKLKELT